MPERRNFRYHDDETLYDRADHEANTCKECFQTYAAEPASAVAQESLVFRRSKFGDPMIVSRSDR